MAARRKLKAKVVMYPDTPTIITETLLKLYDKYKDKLDLEPGKSQDKVLVTKDK